MYDLGDTKPLTITVTDAAETPINVATVSLTITLPDGTTAPGTTVTNPPAQTGIYLYDYVTVQVGRHTVRWVTTGPATAFSDTFDVRPAVSGNLISLKDAKEHLNITSTTDDEEIRGHIAAASKVIADKCGAFADETVVDTLDGGWWEIPLTRWPVKTVTSVVPILTGGATVDVADIDVDKAGVARSKTGLCFPSGRYRWTYTAGRTATDENVILATKIVVKHLWDTQRGAAPAPYAGGDDQTPGLYLPMTPGMLPPRALELLGSTEQVAGFA